MQYPDVCLIVFAKAPVTGRVKTRLIPHIGPDTAAQLHRHLVAHSLDTITQEDLCHVQLWCGSRPHDDYFQLLKRRYRIPVREQEDGDLGLRMFNALTTALTEYRYAIIVGTDCPSLSLQDYRDCILQLRAGKDAVIAPADDGGYVLMGLGRISPELFNDIQWGSDRVFAQTSRRLDALGYQWCTTRRQPDIDRYEDLCNLKQQAGDLGLSPEFQHFLDSHVNAQQNSG